MSKWRSVSDFLCKWKQPAASCSPQITSQGQTARCCLVYRRCFRSAVLASILSNACQPNMCNMLLIPSLTVVYIPRCDLFDPVFSTHTKSLNWGCWMNSKRWILHVWFCWFHMSQVLWEKKGNTVLACYGGRWGYSSPIFTWSYLKNRFCRAIIVFFHTRKAFDSSIFLFYMYFKGTTLQCKTYFCHQIIWAPEAVVSSKAPLGMRPFLSYSRFSQCSSCFCLAVVLVQRYNYYFGGKLLILTVLFIFISFFPHS